MKNWKFIWNPDKLRNSNKNKILDSSLDFQAFSIESFNIDFPKVYNLVYENILKEILYKIDEDGNRTVLIPEKDYLINKTYGYIIIVNFKNLKIGDKILIMYIYNVNKDILSTIDQIIKRGE